MPKPKKPAYAAPTADALALAAAPGQPETTADNTAPTSESLQVDESAPAAASAAAPNESPNANTADTQPLASTSPTADPTAANAADDAAGESNTAPTLRETPPTPEPVPTHPASPTTDLTAENPGDDDAPNARPDPAAAFDELWHRLAACSTIDQVHAVPIPEFVSDEFGDFCDQCRFMAHIGQLGDLLHGIKSKIAELVKNDKMA